MAYYVLAAAGLGAQLGPVLGAAPSFFDIASGTLPALDGLVRHPQFADLLPAMLTSVAEFYEEDVSTRVTGLLSLIEPVIMLVMAVFVGFVLVSLYLPIFSLADSIRP